MLTDARMRHIQALVGIMLEQAEDMNWPLTAGDRVGSAGKPSSRSPGMQQCEWVVVQMERIFEEACASAKEALEIAQPRSRGAEAVRSVGDHQLDPNRRGPYKRRA